MTTFLDIPEYYSLRELEKMGVDAEPPNGKFIPKRSMKLKNKKRKKKKR